MIQILNKSLLALVLFFLAITVNAQSKHFQVNWLNAPAAFPGNCSQCQSENFSDKQYYPVWVYSELTGNQRFEPIISNSIYEPVVIPTKYITELSKAEPVAFANAEERGQNRFKLKLLPYRVTNGKVERLVSFDLTLKAIGPIFTSLNKKGNKTQSVLASGTWYKIKLREDGIYKIDKSFLTKSGININDIDLNTFKVYGNGGGILPEVIATPRVDDLSENAIQVFDGNTNNKMDDGDYILFYGKGPDGWKDNANNYKHQRNPYTDYANYFLTWGGIQGKRITQNDAGQGVTPQMVVTESDYLYVHDVDLINFRNSGREWFGEVLTVENASFAVGLPDVISSPKNFIRSEIAIRTGIPTIVNLYLNGGNFIMHACSTVDFESDDNYADVSTIDQPFSTTGTLNFTYEFIRPQLSSEAWLNYFEVQCKRQMKPIDGQIHLFNIDSRLSVPVKFVVEGLTSDFVLLDVTDPTNIFIQKTFSDGGNSAFIVNPGGKLLRYLVYKNGKELGPEMIGKIENQNLHALQPADFIIITHPDFKSQSEQLAKFHLEREGTSSLIVTPDKIYNEFSSGVLDVTAIRDFIKMIYDRADPGKKPKAVLLFGDASFDFKDRISGNNNLVPTMESYEYNNSVTSYCSDDYYVILGDGEGFWPLGPINENMDIGISRLPAKSSYEADVLVDKCITYKTASNKGEWRSNMIVLGDDEDGNRHMIDSEVLADLAEKEFPPINVNKIYFDAYKQVSLGNGNAYPDVNEAINNSIAKGTLLFNYLGHGGGSGMGHERVVTRPQILSWRNYDRLTYFVTGTCNLAQYDNPKEESPGEMMMSNDQGGAIGMMTTTRKVYIGLNTSFSEFLFKNNIFKRNGKGYTNFGDAYLIVKNQMYQSDNVRNYVNLGDPLMDLNLPIESTLITKINGNTVQASSKDTLKALSKVEIEGIVTDVNGNILNDFNGDIAVTLFDKKQNYKTLANDPASTVMPFSVRNSVLYRGKASVTAGAFKVSFILPKDIDYSIGHGRIFTYAYNDKTDAVGIYDSAFVGGTSGLLSQDNTGPKIEIFLEDEKFVNGGLVNSNPMLIVKLWDENGINTAGNGVGREILAILDRGTESSKNYVLNDFYSTTVNSYQGGEVRIRLSDLPPDMHTITIRAWDVYNNSSENSADFVVTNNAGLVIRNLLNYPNPFINHTNFHFDHNKPGMALNLTITVMTLSGKVVKTFTRAYGSADSHIGDIEWDGKDAYGDELSRGVYIYKLNIRSADGKSTEEIQKMVLLK